MDDSVIRYETTGPLAVLTMVHEPYNLLDLHPLMGAIQRTAPLADSPRGTPAATTRLPA